MPHALIGYAGSTLRAAEMFRETFPDEPMTVWSIISAGRSATRSKSAAAFLISPPADGSRFRMDTPGGRYCEGLDVAGSYEVLERNAPEAIRGYRTEAELRHLIGTGVTAAAIWHMRGALSAAGLPGCPDCREFRASAPRNAHDGGGRRAD